MQSLFKPRLRSDALTAVCVGDDGIACATVRGNGGAVPVLELCTYLSLQVGDDRAQALARLVKSQRLDTLPATSAMDLEQYTLLLVEAPEVPSAELRAAMRWRVKDLIDYHVDDAVIDVFEVPTHKGGRGSHMLYVVAARANVVRRRVDELLDAGLALATVDIPELALRNVTALLPEDVGGVAFVYLSGDRGLITLTRQATLYLSRRIEIGGSFPAHGGDALSPEIEGRLDAIVIEVQRSLDYYESHFGQPPIAGLVLSPLPQPVAGVAEYLGRQLGVPARVLDLNEIIDVAEPLGADLQPRCLIAVGAALRAEGKAL